MPGTTYSDVLIFAGCHGSNLTGVDMNRIGIFASDMVAFTRIEATIVSPKAGQTLHYDPTENGYDSFILVGFSDCGIPDEGRCKVPLTA